MVIESYVLKDRTDPDMITVSFSRKKYNQIIDDFFILMRDDLHLDQSIIASNISEEKGEIIIKNIKVIEQLLYYSCYNCFKVKNKHLWNNLWTDISDQIFNRTWPMELPTYLDTNTNEVFFIGPQIPFLTLNSPAGYYHIIFNIEKDNKIFKGEYCTFNMLDFYYRNQIIDIPKEMLESAEISPGDRIKVWAFIRLN